jgi:hypothetical protein
MGKVKNHLAQFLVAIDATCEGTLREIMGEEYIDTPGFYSMEGADYDGIFEFMQQNMGHDRLETLIDWHDRNPEKVEQIIAPIFCCQEN